MKRTTINPTDIIASKNTDTVRMIIKPRTNRVFTVTQDLPTYQGPGLGVLAAMAVAVRKQAEAKALHRIEVNTPTPIHLKIAKAEYIGVNGLPYDL